MPKSPTNPARKPLRETNLSLEIEYLPTSLLIKDPNNSRKHPKHQQISLLASVSAFGLTAPILIDEENRIIAGHLRLDVAIELKMDEVPCIRVTHLSAVQKRALAIADNRVAELAVWDPDILRAEFESLCKLEFPVELTGFATGEIDLMFDIPSVSTTSTAEATDLVPEPDRDAAAVSRVGDCWICDGHRLLCGDALLPASYEALLGDNRAAMIVTDPPWNCRINGHVSGLGKVKHREFVQATGELTSEQFIAFLKTAMDQMVRFSVDGSIHFIFMDWRMIGEITVAASETYSELKNVCVWDKRSGSMGSLYRSQHELVFVYKNGRAPHQNNVQLGKYGRNRTNIWSYPGANSFGRNREADLAAHPTVKNTAMITDAIRDCSKRGDIILDPFSGSGTILLACERSGRKAAAIELDPYYVDTAVRRWQERTGQVAILSGTDKPFALVAEERRQGPPIASTGDAGPDNGHD